MRRFASDIVISLVVLAALSAPAVTSAQDGASAANDITPVEVEQRAQHLAEQLAEREQTVDEPADTPPADVQPANIEQQPLGKASAPPGERLLPKAKAGGSSWMLSTLGSLGVVIALILLLRWGWLKVGGQPAVRPSALVEVLSRTSIAPRNHVLLLRVGSRVLIVGDSPGGMRTLADVTDPEEVADLLAAVTSSRDGSITRGFSQVVSRFQGDYETPNPELEGADAGEHRLDRAREALSSTLSRMRTLASGRGAA